MELAFDLHLKLFYAHYFKKVKGERMEIKRLSVLVKLALVITILVTLLMVGCATKTTPTTASVPAPAASSIAPASSATPSATSAAPAPTSSAPAPSQATKILKVGAVVWMGWPMGLDMTRALQVMMDQDNARGGLDIGGTKYKMELVFYDHNMDVAAAEAAVNKLIFEDKVSYILADPVTIDAWLPITEENKVIAMGPSVTPVILDPAKRYCFMSGFMNNQSIAVPSWFAAHNPNKKTVICAYPDDQRGHDSAGANENVLKSLGMSPTTEYYPANSQDLSALGTKVKNKNPDVFMAQGGADALALKAVYQAGYKGQLLANNESPLSAISQTCPIAGLEGMISGADPTEFDPALTEYAKTFKAAWIAKYGKWEDPAYGWASTYDCLKGGLVKAGSTNTDKVAEAIAGGISYESIVGSAQMVSRPDLGNNRCVDSVVGMTVKQVVNSKIKLLETIDLQTALANFKAYYK
jgi:branched-chain amino acid transport system substrate-binding protein